MANGGGGTLMRTQDGRTALICAALKGHTDCVRLLLDAGADTNATDRVRARAGVVCVGGA